MPRKGWTAVPVPDGWLQVIRGPRPPAAKWPKTRPNPPSGWSTQSERRAQPVPSCDRGPGHCFVECSRSSDEAGSRYGCNWRVRPSISRSAGCLEDGQAQAQVKPVQDRIGRTEFFLQRARKRVAAARQEVEKAKEVVVNAEGKLALEEEEVRKAEARLLVPQQEASHMPANPPPTVPADFVQELTKLHSLVQELQHERDELRAELATHAEVSEGRPRKSNRISRDAIARFGDVFTTPVGHFPPRERQGVVFRGGDSHRPGRVCNEVWPFRSNEFCMRRRARCGLRGVWIGEASHPGPPKLRIVGASQGEVPSTVPASDGALEAMDRGRVVAMDSDTESLRSGVRSHHSLEDAFEMDLNAVPESEVGSAVDGGVSVVSGEVELPSVEEVFEVPELRDSSPQIRAAFRWMDAVDVEELFRTRAAVFRSIPHFLRGPFRIALRTALAEAIATEHVRQARGWKLFLSMSLLHAHLFSFFRILSVRALAPLAPKSRQFPRPQIGTARGLSMLHRVLRRGLHPPTQRCNQLRVLLQAASTQDCKLAAQESRALPPAPSRPAHQFTTRS